MAEMRSPAPTAAARLWKALCPGMEYARFDACSKSAYDDSKITILRIEPANVKLRLLSASDLGLLQPLRGEEWAEKYDLAIVINAGMFATDWRTHLGYMKTGTGPINNPNARSDYRSVLAFDPQRAGEAPATMLDLDATSIPSLVERYGDVVQNLRMIRRPGVVVWSHSDRKWSEAAVGMDRSGRLLFVFCRSPYTMYELSRCLLGLPIDMVTLQHLEGGGEATLVIRTPALREIEVGSFETGVNDTASGVYVNSRQQYRLPNVLGVSACK